MKTRLIGMSVVLAALMTGCSSNMKPFGAEGYVDLHADAKGLQAWFDGTNGLLQSAKGKPNVMDNHHRLRAAEVDKEKTGLILKFSRPTAPAPEKEESGS